MLISFDLEGTLVGGELFPALGERLGYGKGLRALTMAAMEGRLPFEEALEKRTSLIRGASLDSVKRVADSLPLIQGAPETVRAVRKMGYTPAILTGGFDLLALRAAHELGVKHVLCNHFMTQRGKIEGVVPPIVTAQAKADHMIKLCDALGTPPVCCVAVGDGANDIPMLKAAGFGIAFNASERVRDVARISVEGGDLRDILPYIPLPSDAKG